MNDRLMDKQRANKLKEPSNMLVETNEYVFPLRTLCERSGFLLEVSIGMGSPHVCTPNHMGGGGQLVMAK